MMYVDHYEIKPPIYEKFTDENQINCLHINFRLENGLMYLYKVFSSFCDKCLHYAYNISHESNTPLLHMKSTFTFQ